MDIIRQTADEIEDEIDKIYDFPCKCEPDNTCSWCTRRENAVDIIELRMRKLIDNLRVQSHEIGKYGPKENESEQGYMPVNKKVKRK